MVCIGSGVDRGGPCPGETRDSAVSVAKPSVILHSGIGRALMARDIRQLLAWKTKRNKKQAFLICEKYSSPNLLRYKTGVRGFYSGVNLVYTILTPHAKPSHTRATPLTKNKLRRILLEVYFAYTIFTPPSEDCVPYFTERVR